MPIRSTPDLRNSCDTGGRIFGSIRGPDIAGARRIFLRSLRDERAARLAALIGIFIEALRQVHGRRIGREPMIRPKRLLRGQQLRESPTGKAAMADHFRRVEEKARCGDESLKIIERTAHGYSAVPARPLEGQVPAGFAGLFQDRHLDIGEYGSRRTRVLRMEEGAPQVRVGGLDLPPAIELGGGQAAGRQHSHSDVILVGRPAHEAAPPRHDFRHGCPQPRRHVFHAHPLRRLPRARSPMAARAIPGRPGQRQLVRQVADIQGIGDPTVLSFDDQFAATVIPRVDHGQTGGLASSAARLQQSSKLGRT